MNFEGHRYLNNIQGSNQGKNVLHYIVFWIGKYILNILNCMCKKVETGWMLQQAFIKNFLNVKIISFKGSTFQ